MKIELNELFEKNFKAAYVVLNKEPRYSVILVRHDGTLTSMSYARYLMSCHLKRFLDKTEHVDHKDGNKLNDVISNFQILSQKDNNLKRTVELGQTRLMVELKCPECLKSFIKTKSNSFLDKKGKFNCCSKDCLYSFLKKGYSVEYLSEVGKNQIIKIFRK